MRAKFKRGCQSGAVYRNAEFRKGFKLQMRIRESSACRRYVMLTLAFEECKTETF